MENVKNQVVMNEATKKLVLTAKGRANQLFLNALYKCRFAGDTMRVYPVSYVGSGRYIAKHDYTYYITAPLKTQGIPFTEGNDAPRGGANGNYVQLDAAGFEFICNLFINI